MERQLLILGAGRHGHVVREIAVDMGTFAKIAFLDDNRSDSDCLDVCENFSVYGEKYPYMFPAFGLGPLRMKWISRLEEQGIIIPTLVHPTAVVSETANIFPACVVAPQAVIQPETVVEKGCIISAGAVVGHNTLIGYGCHIDSGAVVESVCMVPALQKINAGKVWTRADSARMISQGLELPKGGG